MVGVISLLVQLHFKIQRETFHHAVVPAIAFLVHAGQNIFLFQRSLIWVSAILTILVGVNR